MEHIVLLGDSIFDNASYVPGGDPVIQQLRARLPRGGRASLLAVDGAVVADVARQLEQLPDDASHLVVSVGGNDALGSSHVLDGESSSQNELFAELAAIQHDFAAEYRRMLRQVLAQRKPTLVCTIYDAIPGLEREAVTALSIFNDVMIRAGVEMGVPILDLRLICHETKDYSLVSPIEPSEIGGSKIVRGILRALNTHDFSRTDSVIYRQA